MRRKQVYMLWTAAGAVLGLGAAHASAAVAPTTTLSIKTSGNSWTAYAQIDSAADNIGLAAVAIDVIGSGGATVTSSFVDLPTAENTIIAADEGNSNPDGPNPGTFGSANSAGGFSTFPSNGVGDSYTLTNPTPDSGADGGYDYTAVPTGGNGVGITGGQNTTTNNTGVVQGYGKTSGTCSGAAVSWTAAPVDIAHGTDSGSGSLTVKSDTTIGQGIQSLNISSGTKWKGPANLTFDTVIPGTASVGSTTPPTVDFSLSGTAGNGGTDLLANGTVTPSADDVNDVLTESGGRGADGYDGIHIHEPTPGVSKGFFDFTGFHQGDNIDVLLKFINTSAGGDPATGQTLSDIENYINNNDAGQGITVSTPSATVAAAFGSSYDLQLQVPAGANDPFADFDFSGFSGDGLSSGQLGLSDIGVVPEPTGLGLMVLGGIGLVGRRRNKKDSK